jgi:hypothetical protein
MPPDLIQIHADYQVGELPAGTIINDPSTGTFYQVGNQLPGGTYVTKVIEGDTGAWEKPAKFEDNVLAPSETFTVFGLPGEADHINTGLDITNMQFHELKVGDVIHDPEGGLHPNAHQEEPYLLVTEADNSSVELTNTYGQAQVIQSYEAQGVGDTFPVAQNIEGIQGPSGDVIFTPMGVEVNAPAPESLVGKTVHGKDLVPGMKVATDKNPNLVVSDQTTAAGAPWYHLKDAEGKTQENVVPTLNYTVLDYSGESQVPQQNLPTSEDLGKVGKVVLGNQLKPGWKIQDLGYKEQGALTVGPDGKTFYTEDGGVSKFQGQTHTVAPVFHYKVIDVGPTTEAKQPKSKIAPPPYNVGDVIKGSQLQVGTVIQSTHGQNHYVVTQGGPDAKLYMEPVDQGESKPVEPNYDFNIISLPGPGGGEVKLTSAALSTLHLGDHVEIGGNEYIVAGVHGDTGVRLKDPLVSGEEGFKTLHHATQVTKLELEPNQSVENFGTSVQDALPAHYSYPPKVIQSWVKAMTEKQYKNFVNHLLYNKNWNHDEIASKIEPWKATAGVLKPAAAKTGNFIDPESGHKMFTSHAGGESWAKSALDGLKNRVASMLWDKVKNAFNGYFDGNYTSINSYLRGNKMGSGQQPGLETQIKAMDAGFAHANPTPEDIAIWRRADWPVPISQGKAIVGHYYRDKGFQSSSYLNNSWSGHLAKLLIPAGTPLIHANDSHMSDHPGEREILVGRGSIYKIVDIVYNGPDGNIAMMVLRWVGNENQGYVIPEGKKLYGTEGVLDRVMQLSEQLVHG